METINPLILFSEEQGSMLIRLVLAQLISDFVLQTDGMVRNKKWFSGSMLLHIGVVLGVTGLLTGLWKLAAILALLHWLVDAMKVELVKRTNISETILFVGDQLLHILASVVLWAYHFDLGKSVLQSIQLPVMDYKISLILLGYVLVIWPVGYLIKFATQNMTKETGATGQITSEATEDKNNKIEHGGKRIGQFERVIILTFVLLQQYEAIGFLITGKSIIRFADKDGGLRSEYVLVGTMMSYAFSIVIGVLVNWLITLAA